MTTKTRRLLDDDRRYLWHPFTQTTEWLEHDPLIIERAEGFHLIDTEGRRFLDGVSSIWCNVHGHGHPKIVAAMKQQLDRVCHSTMLGLSHVPAIELARKLVELTPAPLTRVFYSDSGSTAVEVALRAAFQYQRQSGHPERDRFVTLGEAYHGDTLGSVSLGFSEPFHHGYEKITFEVLKFDPPFLCEPSAGRASFYRDGNGGDCDRDGGYHGGGSNSDGGCDGGSDGDGSGGGDSDGSDGGGNTQDLQARRHDNDILEAAARASLERLSELLAVQGERVAAVFIEPLVQGAAGIWPQPPSFLRGVRELCDRYGILLVCDEVATGFGRSGSMFAVEQAGISPDIMCLAKGLSAGYLPLAATLVRERIFEAFSGAYSEYKTLFHGHTYGGNPLGCAAALANLEVFEEENTLAQAAAGGRRLAGLLGEYIEPLPRVGSIRRVGMMAAFDIVRDRDSGERFPAGERRSQRAVLTAREQGVIIRPLGDTMVLMPPLNLPADLLEQVVAVSARAIESATAQA